MNSPSPSPKPPFDEAQVDAYLERIGLPARPPGAPAQPSAEQLRLLHSRHLRSVPFENLSIHLGEDVPLDPQALFEKIVTRRRGGYCYEVNGAFAALLDSLGYAVTPLAARVHGPAGFGPLFDHLALRVDLAEPWLVDVGFGRHTEFPLRLAETGEQRDSRGVFRIVRTAEGDLDVQLEDAVQYRIEQRPRVLGDFKAMHWFQRTWPDSHFVKSVFCTLLTDDGTVTLAGRRLITTEGGERREETPADDAAVLAAYRGHFGVVLDRVPEVRPAPAFGLSAAS